MSLTKFNENVNNIQTLPDKPNTETSALKALFDKAAGDIKTFLNGTLTTEIDTLISNIQTSLSSASSSISTINSTLATMGTKLDGIENNANHYVHPTTSGNKHIPSGGSSGKILKWASDGTAVWETEKDTTYSVATTSANGLMSKDDKTKLNGIAANANAYTHPTSSGNKHIPSRRFEWANT